MRGFPHRVIGVFKLDAATFEAVEHDAASTGQAALIVIAASAARGLGYLQSGGWPLAAGHALIALVGWLAAASLLWILGTRVLPGRRTEADLGQLLRTIGFAQAPGVLAALAVVPGLELMDLLVAPLWTLAAMVVAVRQALDYTDTSRALVVCVLALVVESVVVGAFVTFGLGLGLGVRSVY